jgi:predicted RNase H-like HicB family nuclease
VTPTLQGCYTQGDTFEEAPENIKDAAKLHLDDMTESGREIPKSIQISLTKIEIPDLNDQN